MKMSKLIAIGGAVLILISFFLPWDSLSIMGTNIKSSGLQKAAGSRPANLDLNFAPSEYGLGSEMNLFYGIIEEVLGSSFSSEEMAILNGVIDAVSKAFARPILYLFPIAAILIAVFSYLSSLKPYKMYGTAMIAVTLLLGFIMAIQGMGTSTTIRMTKLAESIMSLFQVQAFAPSSHFGIGFYGTVLGLIALSVAGYLNWQENSNAGTVPAMAGFQNAAGTGYPNQSYQRGQAATPPQARTGAAGPAPQGQSAFLYQQNHLQYQNNQQRAVPPQQSAPYRNPTAQPNSQQPGYQAPVANQPAPPYQSQPQQPAPPYQSQPQQPAPPYQSQPQQPGPLQPNDPNNLVTGWRAIRPPEDPRQ